MLRNDDARISPLSLLRWGTLGAMVIYVYTSPGQTTRLKQSVENALNRDWSTPISRADLVVPADGNPEERYMYTAEDISFKLQEGDEGKYKFFRLYVMAPPTPGEYGKHSLTLSPNNTPETSFTLSIEDKDYHLKPGYIITKVTVENLQLQNYTLDPLLNPDAPYISSTPH